MPNRLANESSPYLLQHADNPVEWYPWGEEALRLAREEEKPILLSVGYAACHWCHVMAHESFEDEATAAVMNAYFVNVKVDREERPDIDGIYMTAVQALTGQGGWPMTVFLTPDGKPFYGGTYFPPQPRHGMPSFRQVLESVHAAWQNKRSEIVNSAGEIASHIERNIVMDGPEEPLERAFFDRAVQGLANSFDTAHGGFGRAPKFPQPMILDFLLRYHAAFDDENRSGPGALEMVETTLRRMGDGGIYDHLGGGFARYATDNEWLVPHFEKMLYDNAQLARVYLHAYQITGDAYYRRIVEETLDYVVREMRHEAGGFYSSQDADSEGEEGKFYVWRPEEIRQVLEADADLFTAYYDVTQSGNWEGKNILNVNTPLGEFARRRGAEPEEVRRRLARAREQLYEARSRRVWPGLDDKVLTAWNGLMLAAFAEAGRVLEREDYVRVARENATFLRETMCTEEGRLLRTWKAGFEPRYNGYLEDYAYLADGLLALYQTTFESEWYTWAAELAEQMMTHFVDENGGFFDTSDDHEALLYRPKDLQDNAVPSGNAMAAGVLAQLALFSGEGTWWDRAQQATHGLYSAMAQYPAAFGNWLGVALFLRAEPLEVAIAGAGDAPATRALLAVAQDGYRPFQVVAVGIDESEIPLLRDRAPVDGAPAAYVCRHFVCRRPVTEPAALAAELESDRA